MSEQKTEEAAGPSVVLGNSVGGDTPPRGHHSRLRIRGRLAVLGIVAVVIIILVSGGTYEIVQAHERHDQQLAAAKAKQIPLEKAVSSQIKYANDPTTLKSDSNALINSSGSSNLSSAELAQAYAARGAAESNLKEYAAAAADYAKAEQLSPTTQVDSLYNEFFAGYEAGQRKTLIPILQSLIQQEQASKSDFSGSDIATYQMYIQQLQAGQDLAL
jgi:DNA-binding helix-hairpin-helix protein with protein kinase domain